MTPSAKEGLPAVVGELVALVERYSGDGELQSFESRERFRKEARATLSALTAEAGKGEEDERAAFETWATENGHRTLRDRINPDRYADNVTVIAWIAWQGALDYADTLALSTATPAGEWVCVPRKITEAMCDACHNVPSGFAGSPPHPQSIWDAMLAASPRGASESK